LSVRGGDLEKWHYDGNSWSKVKTIMYQTDSNYAYNNPKLVVNYSNDLKLVFCTIYADNYSVKDHRVYACDGDNLVKRITGCATFWVRVTESLDEDRRIYIYYGSDESIDASDGPNTFPLFFDDLSEYSVGDSPDSTKWAVNNADANHIAEIREDPEDASKQCIAIENKVGDGIELQLDGTLKSSVLGLAYHFRMRVSPGDGSSNAQIDMLEGSSEITSIRFISSDGRLKYHDGSSWVDFSPACSMGENAWYDVVHKVFDTSSSYMHVDVDDIDHAGGFRSSPSAGIDILRHAPDKSLAMTLYIGGVGMDNRYIFVRKFVHPEPSISSVGQEEDM